MEHYGEPHVGMKKFMVVIGGNWGLLRTRNIRVGDYVGGESTITEYDAYLMNLFDLNGDMTLLNAHLTDGLLFMIYVITRYGFHKLVSDMNIPNLWHALELD